MVMLKNPVESQRWKIKYGRPTYLKKCYDDNKISTWKNSSLVFSTLKGWSWTPHPAPRPPPPPVDCTRVGKAYDKPTAVEKTLEKNFNSYSISSILLSSSRGT